MSFIRRGVVTHIFGATKGAVADVMDAHLEMLSMIFLTTCWAVGYGWFEAVIGIGFLLGIPGAVNGKVQWYSFVGGLYSSYHLFLGFTIFVITFGIGFLKFNRMLYARKRYLLFTSLASYPWALTVQDFSYFFFAPIFSSDNYGLNSHAWTCHGLNLGCITLANPWKPSIPFVIPEWYFVTLTISVVLFFLAYRSALVNLLVARRVVKEAGFLEKTLLPSPNHTSQTQQELQEAATTRADSPQPTSQPAEQTRAERQVTKIVDADREKLVQKLRERLEHQGA